MSMSAGRHGSRIAVAEPVMRRIGRLRADLARAVEDAIRRIGTEPGEPIDLPNARPGTPYQVQRPADPAAPVIIYRRTRGGEKGDYLVVSLMTPEEYRQQRQDEQSDALRDPGIRRDIAVAAGTAVSILVEAIPGTVTVTPAQGGAVPTIGTSPPPPAD
jgi:hypothetical protein